MAKSSDRIEKQLVLRAPQSRVWRALTDSAEFGAWFGAKLAGPLKPGKRVTGPRAESAVAPGWQPPAAWRGLEIDVERMEPEHTFAFRWHPRPDDPDHDYDADPKTLVTFTLEAVPEGTRLTVVETGFDALPASRRTVARRDHAGGWPVMLERVGRWVAEKKPAAKKRVAARRSTTVAKRA